MITTNYKEYIQELKASKERYKSIRSEFEKKLRDGLESEFSKYLKPMDLRGDQTSFILYDVNHKRIENFKIFLLEEDFGVVVKVRYSDYNTQSPMFADILTVYKYFDNKNKKFKKWQENVVGEVRYDPTQNLEEFVKNYVEKLKKKNEDRKKDKEKRQLKKAMKQYNL